MLYIRTDVNDIIATGHVMRCLAIADVAKKMGEEVTFIIADDGGKCYIEGRGYQTIVLHSAWNNMDTEMPILIDLIQKKDIKVLFIDSYQVTEYYFRVLSDYVKTIYIDDLNKINCRVNAIICYMSYWEKLHYKTNYPNTKLLLGLQYTPIREAFQNVAEKKICKTVNSLLLLSGGTDQYGALEKILECVKDKGFKEIIVICGRYYLKEDRLREKYQDYDNIQILKSVDNIEKYMLQADLAISAGGITLYELCACGTPTISYAIADNQLESVKSFHNNQIIDYAGDVRNNDVFEKLNRMIIKYCNDVELRKERSMKMRKMVDGKGASRIVEEWKELLKE